MPTGPGPHRVMILITGLDLAGALRPRDAASAVAAAELRPRRSRRARRGRSNAGIADVAAGGSDRRRHSDSGTVLGRCARIRARAAAAMPHGGRRARGPPPRLAVRAVGASSAALPSIAPGAGPPGGLRPRRPRHRARWPPAEWREQGHADRGEALPVERWAGRSLRPHPRTLAGQLTASPSRRYSMFHTRGPRRSRSPVEPSA